MNGTQRNKQATELLYTKPAKRAHNNDTVYIRHIKRCRIAAYRYNNCPSLVCIRTKCRTLYSSNRYIMTPIDNDWILICELTRNSMPFCPSSAFFRCYHIFRRGRARSRHSNIYIATRGCFCCDRGTCCGILIPNEK